MDSTPLHPGESAPPAEGAAEGTRFLPGTVLGGRYRIVAPLGRGGMGEVYRADDLKLAHPVALKFLPAALAGDEQRAALLRAEVKAARQVSHPNVCRVWDLGEADGVQFLAMEYVDGEDLRSLLRRIGRLPEDRAVVVARQLCAGLAAVHDQGLLHRDLKPANVMLDGRGRVRLTDFGLAAAARETPGHEASAGTPAYMAPEQLAGREATVRSDLYSLGLVLYEVFTGHPAFPAGPSHPSRTAPTRPASHVRDLDPAVERAILQCLEPDPAARPASALAIAAALPGGDPLSAALAAGETPSPELVAAAGDVGGLRPAAALACVALVLAGLAANLYLGDRRVAAAGVDLGKPPEVLRERALQILDELRFGEPAADSLHGLVRGPRSPDGKTTAFYWYRQAPFRILPRTRDSFYLTEPRMEFAGEIGLRLDTQGGLLEFRRVPRAADPPASTPSDWSALFAAARLEQGLAEPAPPAAIPPVFGDAQFAWEARRAGLPLRIEASSFRGRPVHFLVGGAGETTPPSMTVIGLVMTAFLLALAVTAAFVARRNLRLGRGDLAGGWRVGILGLLIALLGWGVLDEPRFVLTPSMLFLSLCIYFYFGCLYWASYLAVEPTIRSRWPQRLTSWARLLGGRWRDALVGRDLLFGVVAGLGLALLLGLIALTEARGAYVGLLARGGWGAAGAVVRSLGPGVLYPMMALLVLGLARGLLRRPWAAVLAAFPVVTLIFASAGRSLLESVVVAAVLVLLLLRYGLLSGIAALTVAALLDQTVMTLHLTVWYADMSHAALLTVLALGAWGLVGALGGARPTARGRAAG